MPLSKSLPDQSVIARLRPIVRHHENRRRLVGTPGIKVQRVDTAISGICESGQPRVEDPLQFGCFALENDDQQDNDNDEQRSTTDIHGWVPFQRMTAI